MVRLIRFSIIFFLLSIFWISCKSFENKQINPNRTNQKDLLKLHLVSRLPDDSFYPKGDSIYRGLLDKGKSISNELIVKISDTTDSKYFYANSFYYKVGDISLCLLSDIYKTNFSLRKIVSEEFRIKGLENERFDVIFYDLFHTSDKKKNLKNRVRLQDEVKRWYEEYN